MKTHKSKQNNTKRQKNIPQIKLDEIRNLNELSKQLYDKILGIPADFGCGSAVCMLDGTDFKFGMYNREEKK